MGQVYFRDSGDKEWYDDDHRYLTKREIEELSQTREDACPDCFTIHKGECL